MPHAPCGDAKCRRFPMTLREFGKLTGEDWDQSFRARLGKAATKLYREIYGKEPGKRRSRMSWRNKVGRYPCGILEQAYRELKAGTTNQARPDRQTAQGAATH